MEIAIDAINSRFSQGTVALLNNGNQGIIFDNINFLGVECTVNSVDAGTVIYDGPETFRYTEKCNGEFAYKQWDHEEADVSGKWECKRAFEGRYGAII